jgi:hypothetical protein
MAELLRRIRSGEGSYTSINRGRAGDTPGGDKKLTSMTLADVMASQQRGDKFAVGAYQFIPGTLAGAVIGSGLDPNTRFTPEVQDRLAQQLILGGAKRPTLTRYLTGKSNDLAGATDDIAGEWAALRGSGGRGRYDGDSAGNMASIGVGDLLPRVRAEVMGGGVSLAAPVRSAAVGSAAEAMGTPAPAASVSTTALRTAEDEVARRFSDALASGDGDPWARAFGWAPRQRMAGSRLGLTVQPISA